MSNKNFPKVKDVIDLQSSVLLELLLTRTLSKTDLATIKKNTSMLLGIVTTLDKLFRELLTPDFIGGGSSL